MHYTIDNVYSMIRVNAMVPCHYTEKENRAWVVIRASMHSHEVPSIIEAIFVHDAIS